MTTTQIPATVKETPKVKTLMDLGHLSVPNSSHPPKSWLTGQREQREKAIEALMKEAKAWFPIDRMPEDFYLQFARKAISALDNF